MIVASPTWTAGAMVTVATSPSLIGMLFCIVTSVWAIACGSGPGGGVSSVILWAAVSMKPPPRRVSASRPAFMTSLTVKPRAVSRSSLGWIWTWRSAPP